MDDIMIMLIGLLIFSGALTIAGAVTHVILWWLDD